ncbi:ISNCY family transposase, partial [Candidatus Curtissbacteria bacterium]|nr:ISNCY family transposase [Candidatus Curtissbacteria bacterium]
MSNRLILSSKEQEKLDVIKRALEKKITNGHAAKILGVSLRQIKRLKKNIRAYGTQGVVHRLKGKPSNHHIAQNIKDKTLELIKEKYADFKPAFASEKLKENHSITVNAQTVRRWMIQTRLWKSRKQKKNDYRSWRPRKEYFGEMQQFDGSYHLWFERRYCDNDRNPIEVCLLASIDDATGKITKAEFTANEGVVAVFTFWKAYIISNGKPLSVYLDKFSTYKINHKAAVDNHELMTQFERATKDLSILLITAHSPEAKGRVERLFGTLQDRLVKEMRLLDINTPEEGNKFLEEVFLPKFNSRFSVMPTKEGNVHKLLSELDQKNLNRIFSIQSRRKVNNDFTIQFKNNWYQLAEVQPVTVRARDTILVEEWLDGTIHFSLRGQYLVYTVLPERPKRVKRQP